jgi:hypothetical protein
MPCLENPKWERFVQAYIETGSPSEAYKIAGFRSIRSISSSATKLLRIPVISARIAELQQTLAEDFVDRLISERSARLAALEDRWHRIAGVIRARAERGKIALRYAELRRAALQARTPPATKEEFATAEKEIEFGRELSTGILTGPDHKGNYRADIRMLAECREIEKQAAIECGQWEEKTSQRLQIDGQSVMLSAVLSLEELQELRRRMLNAREAQEQPRQLAALAEAVEVEAAADIEPILEPGADASLPADAPRDASVVVSEAAVTDAPQPATAQGIGMLARVAGAERDAYLERARRRRATARKPARRVKVKSKARALSSMSKAERTALIHERMNAGKRKGQQLAPTAISDDPIGRQ